MARGAPRPGRSACLRGRASESSLLEELLSAIRRGESRALVIRGEAGIGKTALLRYLIESASDLTVVRAVGVESEMELAYASLHLLCAPLLDRLSRLPAPQRRALETVFGLGDGAAPDRFLVGMAVLSLLSDAADERPLLCVVDDAQWLDQASALTLAFVARRLLAEPVGMVFASREPGAELGYLPKLEVRGLGNSDARALLDAGLRLKLDTEVRDRIIAETQGNPLALLELPRGLTATQLAGGFGLPKSGPLSGRIEKSFLRRIEKLPDETRRLLLLAAAEPTGDAALMWRAATRLGVARTEVDEARETGLIDVGVRVRFRHPLVRSAVYRAASDLERQTVHAALAVATDAELEPDRRAWHRAHATPGPDEDVAAELERSADRAQARGGLAAAAAFLGRAADLTVDPTRRAGRMLAAAQVSLQAGEFHAALRLLTAARAGPLDELRQARAELLSAGIAFAQNRGSDAPPLLLQAAKTLENLDARLSRETYLDAWSAALFAGELATAGSLLDVSRAVITAPKPTPRPRPCDLLLDGFALVYTEGRSAAAPVLQRAATAFAGSEVSVEEVLRWAWLATVAAVYVWDYDTCLAVATREVEVARESGALEVLAVGDNILCQALCMSGDFAKAELLVAEANAVREATEARIGGYGALFLAGFRGREAEASKLIDATIREATPSGQGTALQYANYANAVIMNSLGCYEEALASATRASDDMPGLVVARWSLGELIEAASRTQNIEVAERALDQLSEHASGSDSEWAVGIEARARALLRDGEEANGLYRQAIDRLGRTRLRPELARAHLLYGEWLRRENRRVDARAQLRTAHDQFESIGMEAFAERARMELLATGEKVRKRTVETRDELTEQERQIARLARDGLSNAEIGERLFLSPRTIEWHLRKVFTNLGIHSRRELISALAGSESEPLTT